VVSEPRKISFLSVAERREKILQPCRREEETGKYLIQQRKEKCREEETGKYLIQQWKEKCVNYVPGLMLWRQHRGAQLTLGISARLKVKMKLEKGEEVAVEDAAEECLFRVVARIGAREKMDIPVYEGNLDVEELLDWIRALDKYFDYEDVEEDKKVKHVVTRLKGHATLWWDELQADRRCKGKQKIKSWDRMVAKMKAKFIPRDYQITLFRRMQNLRQKLMSVKEYTEEFYRINIRAGHRESDDEKVSRYMNGLRYDIQDEMSMMTIQKCGRCLSDGSES
jgi:hypothetical protein